MKEISLPYAAGMKWWIGRYWVADGSARHIEVPAFTIEDAEYVLTLHFPASRIDGEMISKYHHD